MMMSSIVLLRDSLMRLRVGEQKIRISATPITVSSIPARGKFELGPNFSHGSKPLGFDGCRLRKNE